MKKRYKGLLIWVVSGAVIGLSLFPFIDYILASMCGFYGGIIVEVFLVGE